MKTRFVTEKTNETKKLAEKAAKSFLKNKKRNSALVIALIGELGSGKTTFLQGFAKGLGIKEKILSPTFVLMRRFEISGKRNFYHLDCYRVKSFKELLGLGVKEIIANPKNIVAIEWAYRIKKMFPKKYILIKFKFISENKREIIIKD